MNESMSQQISDDPEASYFGKQRKTQRKVMFKFIPSPFKFCQSLAIS